MAEEMFIAGLGPGVPEWSNEATQKQVLNALNNGFSTNTSSNAAIINALSRISKNEDDSVKLLQNLLNDNKKVSNTIADNTKATRAGDTKTHSIFNKMKDLLVSGNKVAREQLAHDKRVKAFNANVSKKMAGDDGMDESEARMQASFEQTEGDFKEAKKNITGLFSLIAAGVASSKMVNAMVTQAAGERFDMTQEIRQSGLMAGIDSAGSGLLSLSQTISGANFTFGEAQAFTQQFAKAVGVRGVSASLEFANQLAQSGKSGGDMMNKYGMEFSEVAEIAGSYMESVRTIGQLDKLSDTQMRSGMDNFMDTVVSTSNIMKINLQDAANLIADTLKQDQFASQLALMEPAMAESVRAMVGQFGGEGTILGQGIATAMASGSTQNFLQTDVAQQLQGDVIGQQLMPIITEMAEIGRTQGPEAAREFYENSTAELESIMDFAKGAQALVLQNNGMSQAIVAQIAQSLQTIADANSGYTGTSAEDRTMNQRREIERQQELSGEAVQNFMLEKSNITENIGKLNVAMLEKTKELRAASFKVVDVFAPRIVKLTTSVDTFVTGVEAKLLSIANTVFGSDDIIGANTTALENLTKAIGGEVGDAKDKNELNEKRAYRDARDEDAKAEIKELQARIKRSMDGKNEFWGSEEAGQNNTKAEIKKLEDGLGVTPVSLVELNKVKKAESITDIKAVIDSIIENNEKLAVGSINQLKAELQDKKHSDKGWFGMTKDLTEEEQTRNSEINKLITVLNSLVASLN